MHTADYLPVMIDAARAGGEKIRQRFRTALDVTEKSMASDQQTLADLESEQAIISILAKQCPKVAILAEESNGHDTITDAPTFVIDPLNGTNNFLLGIPYFAVSIGLFLDKTTVAAVVYHPILEETYSAALGTGAFLDDVPLRVSQEADPTRYTIGWTGAYGGKLDNFINLLRVELRPKRRLQNWCPALDLCLLAQGKIEVFVVEGPELYDICASKLNGPRWKFCGRP